MKKKTKTNNNKKTVSPAKSKRWRPPKAFISKKPQIKREKPGRPKKHEKVILPQIPEKKENKVKDAIILGIFVISFMIFGFSLYVSQKEKIAWLMSNEETTNEEITNEETRNEVLQEETKEEQIPTVAKDSKLLILEGIYWAIKEAKIDEIYQYIDTNLKQTSTFKTYFSKNRLQRFLNNIDNQNISIESLSIDNDTGKIHYKVMYSIKNTPFIEEREAFFITKENELKIAKIMCVTQGCSKMPFFNPGKYF